jgi:hypothetical protein
VPLILRLQHLAAARHRCVQDAVAHRLDFSARRWAAPSRGDIGGASPMLLKNSYVTELSTRGRYR